VIFGKDNKMNVSPGTKLLLAVTIAVLLTANSVCLARQSEKSTTPKDEPKQWKLTDQTVERIMQRLAETDPKKAEELQKLRDKDPNEFKAELRKIQREKFAEFRRIRETRNLGAKAQSPFMMDDRPSGGRRRRGEMRQRFVEYLEGLEKIYPEEAKKLAEMKEKQPDVYRRRVGLSYRRYGRIVEKAKDDPNLAQVLKENFELKKERNELVGKIKAASDEGKKKKLNRELEEVLSKRFDALVKWKQMEYELLLERLERLKEEIKKSKANIEKWKDDKFKEENIKAHIKELLSPDKDKKFRWH